MPQGNLYEVSSQKARRGAKRRSAPQRPGHACEPFAIGPFQEPDTVITQWEERDAWEFVPIRVRKHRTKPLVEGEPLELDVVLSTTWEHIAVHLPKIDLVVDPIGRQCRCASQPCGCPRSKDQRYLFKGAVRKDLVDTGIARVMTAASRWVWRKARNPR